MGFLFPPVEKVLARKFCSMVHDLILRSGEEHAASSVQRYLEHLRPDDEKLAKAIEVELKGCNRALFEKLSIK